MKIIAFLIIILNLNLFAVDIPQFKNKIAISGDVFYKMDKNGNIELVYFSYYSFNEGLYENKVLDKPITNTLFFDKINPYNTKELHYYNINKSNGKINTNYYTFMIEKDILIQGYENPEEGDIDSNDPYDYNDSSAIAIFVDYNKYGKKYIENLINRDHNRYRARYFEGKYVSEDAKSYFTLKRLSGNSFSIEGKTPNYTINISDDGEYNTVKLDPQKREISIGFMNDNEYINIKLNILDNNSLIVFERTRDNVLGFHGLYTKVLE